MPWHKVRVYYDREAERQQRSVYRLRLSVLLAAALLVVVVVIGIYPFVEFWSMPSTHTAGMAEWRMVHDVPDFPTATQEICALVALVRLAHISIALSTRTR